jgi:hypothetical protein
VQKRDKGKAVEQPTAIAAAVEQDSEIEDLEQKCFSELLECCKTMSTEYQVNYTSIMNIQVII